MEKIDYKFIEFLSKKTDVEEAIVRDYFETQTEFYTQQGTVPRGLLPRKARHRYGRRLSETEKLFLECRHFHLARGNDSKCLPYLSAYYGKPL